MLAVALIIGQMTAGLRYQARVASYREERARALYEFARDMSSLLQTEQVVEPPRASDRATRSARRSPCWCPTSRSASRVRSEDGAALERRHRRRAVGVRQVAAGRRRHRHARRQRIPVPAAARADAHARRARDQAGKPTAAAGARADAGTSTPSPRSPRSRSSACTTSRSRSRRSLHMESERLRNSLLAALSHDLRTPLAALRRTRRNRSR